MLGYFTNLGFLHGFLGLPSPILLCCAATNIAHVLHLSAGSLAAVKVRMQALKGAVKKTVGAAAAAAVAREVVPGGYPHGAGGYAFRQRKAPGALAELSAGQNVLLYIFRYTHAKT